MLDYKKIGQFIYEERKKLNITQEELGELLFVTRQAISKWERGKCMPDYDSLLRLSKIFSTSIDEIIYGKRFFPKRKNKIAFIILFFVMLLFSIMLYAILFTRN